MKSKGKQFREFLAEAFATFVADKILATVISTDFLVGVWVAVSGQLKQLSTQLSQLPITQLQTQSVVLLVLLTLLFCVSLVVVSNFLFTYYRRKKDVLFIKDDDIKFAYYVNQGALDPFPFCRKHEVRMNPPDMSGSTYKCGECGDEVHISIYSPEWEYRKNTAISKVEKILRGRKRLAHGI